MEWILNFSALKEINPQKQKKKKLKNENLTQIENKFI
jgi:hypothetical protein